MENYLGITLYQQIMSMTYVELAAYLSKLMNDAAISALEGEYPPGVFAMLKKLEEVVVQ